jgi:hypothetical protein
VIRVPGPNDALTVTDARGQQVGSPVLLAFLRDVTALLETLIETLMVDDEDGLPPWEE